MIVLNMRLYLNWIEDSATNRGATGSIPVSRTRYQEKLVTIMVMGFFYTPKIIKDKKDLTITSHTIM